MIRVYILDDEPLAIKSLKLLLQLYLPQIEVVGESTLPLEAIQQVERLQPEILFIDIRMPEMSGLDVIRQIKQWNGNIIFTTAYSDYSIKALRLGALDYLLKPVDPDELQDAINRLQQRDKTPPPNYHTLSDGLKEQDKRKLRMEVRFSDRREYVTLSDIIYIEGDRNYTKIHLHQKPYLFTSKTLGQYEEQLNFLPFYRMHKSYLVNLDYAQHIESGNIMLLKNGLELQISRNKKEELIRIMKSDFH
jgi:two-component system LytT family response regulator